MSKNEIPRLFIECTHTFFRGGNSGIQRVVRNLVHNGLKAEKGNHVHVRPIIWTGSRFIQPRAKIKVRQHTLVYLKVIFYRIFHFLVKISPLHFLANITPSFIRKPLGILRRTLFQGKGYRRFKSRLWEVLLFTLTITSMPLKGLLGKRVKFRAGDLVVLVDSTWRSNPMLGVLFQAQQEIGLNIGVMFHDLFPLTHPELCQEVTREGFLSWFPQVVSRADFFVTNSESTRATFMEYLVDHPELRPQGVTSGSFHLGAELDDLASKKGKKSKYLQTIWNTPGWAILAIGTIEPRKNYSYLLDAYDLLRKKSDRVSLIIVGRPGWKTDDVIHRILTHQDYGRNLIWVGNANDWELSQAMERAHCQVCPSLAEGFGLPLAEGLMRNTEMFASDIPPFREIGQNQCTFFNLEDPACLSEILEEWVQDLNDDRPRPERPPFSWPNWEESTKEFVQVVLRLSNTAPENISRAAIPGSSAPTIPNQEVTPERQI